MGSKAQSLKRKAEGQQQRRMNGMVVQGRLDTAYEKLQRVQPVDEAMLRMQLTDQAILKHGTGSAKDADWGPPEQTPEVVDAAKIGQFPCIPADDKKQPGVEAGQKEEKKQQQHHHQHVKHEHKAAQGGPWSVGAAQNTPSHHYSKPQLTLSPYDRGGKAATSNSARAIALREDLHLAGIADGDCDKASEETEAQQPGDKTPLLVTSFSLDHCVKRS